MPELNKNKLTFCQSSRCVVFMLILVAIGIGIVVLVTLLSPAVRSTYVALTDRHTDTLPWWKTTIVYQIYPRSYQDSDGDGTGDLRGIISHLDYLRDNHVGAIWLNPFYESAMRDFGYDVINYTSVDPIFGTMGDFEDLITAAHSKDVKVIVDFVPNHSSNDSGWFQASRRAADGDQYRDYYIWRPPRYLDNGTRLPPNNWVSSFGGPAWTWDDVAHAYYYHNYLESQPDMNYRNPRVLEEMDNVLRFWLDKGVDGFRIDAIIHLFEDLDLSKNDPPGQPQKYTKNLPEIFDVVRRWRDVVSEYETKDGQPRYLVAETVFISTAQRHEYYRAGSVPFDIQLVLADRICNATVRCYHDIVRRGTALLDPGEWPNFVIGNHDTHRVADRVGDEYVDAMNMLLLMLPGTPTTYYGEELGMRGGNYTGQPPRDPKAITSGNLAESRDPERNPMQWDTSANAGFTSGTPWLDVTDNTRSSVVNVQVESDDPGSSLQLYRRLAELRQREAFQNANIELADSADNILSFIRGDNKEQYWIGVNIGTETESMNVNSGHEKGTVTAVTPSLMSVMNTDVDLSNITLKKGEGLVINLK